MIRAAVQRRAGDKKVAAEDLQISLASLYSKLRAPGDGDEAGQA
ncbi:hypothetical protein DRQ32_05940 [bacterium]|nr:MAG: hypothetical protein DRQ32_05940 [bacterium]